MMQWAILMFMAGTSLVTLLLVFKVQGLIMVLQEYVESMNEPIAEDFIGFRSDTAPPQGTEGDEVELEYQTGEPLTYDQARKR